MFCNHCGKQIEEGSRFCAFCGQALAVNSNATQPINPTPPPFNPEADARTQRTSAEKFQDAASAAASAASVAASKASSAASSASSAFVEGLNSYMGNKNSVKLNWKDLFSAVFKKHTNQEAEDIFICGTSKTTPPLDEVSETWPKPWLYSRVLLFFAITYVLLYICCTSFENLNAIPGTIIIGSFAVPFTTLVLFMEVNAFRNISVYDVFKFFFIGGCASLVVTLFLFDLDILDTDITSTWGAMMVGVIEEIGKLAIVYYLIKKLPNCNYILSALLAGACVGAGFAAFESAGYAFRFLIFAGFDDMTDVIYQRALLAPGGHVAWAAISGAALVIAKGSAPLSFDVFGNSRFWKIFAIPVILHGLWDAPILMEHPFIKLGALIFLVWMVVLILINMGLDQVKNLKTAEPEEVVEVSLDDNEAVSV